MSERFVSYEDITYSSISMHGRDRDNRQDLDESFR